MGRYVFEKFISSMHLTLLTVCGTFVFDYPIEEGLQWNTVLHG